MIAGGAPGGPVRRVVVIGVGNEFRRDDGVGPEVLSQLGGAVPATVRLVASDGEPARMIEAWTGADLAVVVDALQVSAGRPATGQAATGQAATGQAATGQAATGQAGGPAPGRTYRLVIDEVTAEPATAVSSHGLGLGDAIGLARALDLMPARLIVHAVEVTDCGYGVGLTPAVAAAAATVTSAVLRDLRELGVPV